MDRRGDVVFVFLSVVRQPVGGRHLAAHHEFPVVKPLQYPVPNELPVGTTEYGLFGLSHLESLETVRAESLQETERVGTLYHLVHLVVREVR